MAHLIRSHIAKYTAKTRDFQDRRKLVARVVFAYYERDTHHEYRKSFTAPANTPESKFWDIAPRIIIQ
jgi:hypothetical protein